jgi:Family of unknown function (DUF6526)
MKPQNYSNHIRWYVPHHFIFYPVMLAAMGFCAARAWCIGGERTIWLAIGFGFGCLTWLSYMLRQHYALVLQNRLVLQELRYRHFVITGTRLEPLEEQLTEGQLFALRFAPDGEFVALLNRAISENLSPNDIKKAIVNWKPDHRRV